MSRFSLTERRICVLLIDDQPIMGKAVGRMLASEEDIDFHFCPDPTEAVRTAVRVSPTVILLDLVMPQVNGMTLVRYFRATKALEDVPLVVLSAREEPEAKAEAFALGANDYMVKFPDRLEVVARIRYHSKGYINLIQRNEAYKALLAANEQLEEKTRELEILSATDRLTRVYNRLKLDEFLKSEFARSQRYGHPLSVILLDIDHFKAVNDTYGHPAGDKALCEVANLLQTRTRKSDLLGRWGGEEFMIICAETGIDGARTLAEELRSSIENHPFPVVGSKTASFGVAERGADDTIESLINRADEALYRAKAGGRNRVEAGVAASDSHTAKAADL